MVTRAFRHSNNRIKKSKCFILMSLRNQAAVTQMSRKMWQSAAIFETKEKKSGESGLL